MLKKACQLESLPGPAQTNQSSVVIHACHHVIMCAEYLREGSPSSRREWLCVQWGLQMNKLVVPMPVLSLHCSTMQCQRSSARQFLEQVFN